MKTKLLFFLISYCILGVNAEAQNSEVLTNSDTAQIAPVVKKAIVKKALQLKTLKPEAGLEDYLLVKVENLETLQKEAIENKKKIVLYFNEIPMHGIYADFISTRDSSIIFKLTRDTISLKAWNIFYQGQTFSSRRKVAVSVGFENGGSIDTEVKDFSLVLVRKHLLIGALIGILILLILFILLVKKTGIIKDDKFIDNQGAYSLARTQLAFWTFIIIFSFIFIWVVTGELPPVTGSTLILLTISMATTAGAKVIDSSKNTKPNPLDALSDGFFKDIISDHAGVSIHRFQMAIWTVVLGVFFLRGVIKELAMPQFEESLLILMGVSSGTYLGLKIPEAPSIDTSLAKPEEVELAGDIHQHEDTPAVG